MQIIPYLILNGTAKSAFEYYATVLDGEIVSAQSFGDMPPSEDFPVSDELKPKMMNIILQIGQNTIMASDSWDGTDPDKAGCSLSIQINDLEDAKSKFDKLADGGQVTMPFEPTFWAKGFGSCIDKFGVHWMVNCE